VDGLGPETALDDSLLRALGQESARPLDAAEQGLGMAAVAVGD